MMLVFASVSVFAQSNFNEVNESTVSSTIEMLTNGGGRMQRSGRYLTLDGRKLSDTEVQGLISAENYETYISAKKQIATGSTFTGVFIGSLAATAALLYTGYTAKNTNILYLAYIPAIAADVSLPLLFIFNGIGKGRMSWVADDYNEQSQSSVSYNFSPSIMHCEAMSGQANLGFGMTFSVNF